jgi:hypothetical protein
MSSGAGPYYIKPVLNDSKLISKFMPKQYSAAHLRVKPPVSSAYGKKTVNRSIKEPGPCPNGNETLFLNRIKI